MNWKYSQEKEQAKMWTRLQQVSLMLLASSGIVAHSQQTIYHLTQVVYFTFIC